MVGVFWLLVLAAGILMLEFFALRAIYVPWSAQRRKLKEWLKGKSFEDEARKLLHGDDDDTARA